MTKQSIFCKLERAIFTYMAEQNRPVSIPEIMAACPGKKRRGYRESLTRMADKLVLHREPYRIHVTRPIENGNKDSHTLFEIIPYSVRGSGAEATTTTETKLSLCQLVGGGDDHHASAH